MNAGRLADLADRRAVLYEGYILYPYRPSAIKNRHRFALGGLAPRDSGEPWSLRAEFLVIGGAAELSASLRFLHPLARTGGGSPDWQEAVEREVPIPPVLVGERTASVWMDFGFPDARSTEETPAGTVARTQEEVSGEIQLSAVSVAEGVFRVIVRVENLSPCDPNAGRDAVALRTFLSVHVALRLRGGEFVSLTDPPQELREAADHCHNEGVWPVLVGDPSRCDTILASPIILEDFPQVAPESPGDFFDGTEIDEMLALRIRTLTDDEKREMAAADARSRAILERVESLPAERLRRLHGANRSARGPRVGDHVRLCPRGRADALDVLLTGKFATVVAVEVDFEGATHLAVTVDGDPGGDLGAAGQVGHRFFFRPEEVEPVTAGGES